MLKAHISFSFFPKKCILEVIKDADKGASVYQDMGIIAQTIAQKNYSSDRCIPVERSFITGKVRNKFQKVNYFSLQQILSAEHLNFHHKSDARKVTKSFFFCLTTCIQ